MDEIQKILLLGNFEKQIPEESFLLGELAHVMPEETINIIERKLFNSIDRLNDNQNLDVFYFKYILVFYIEEIRKHDIDELERFQLVKKKIKTQKLKDIFVESWPESSISSESKINALVE